MTKFPVNISIFQLKHEDFCRKNFDDCKYPAVIQLFCSGALYGTMPLIASCSTVKENLSKIRK